MENSYLSISNDIDINANGFCSISASNNLNLHSAESAIIDYYTSFGVKKGNNTLISCDDHEVVELYGSGVNIIGKYTPGADEGSVIVESRNSANAVKTKVEVNNTGITITGLPSSDPHVAGGLWNDNGVLKISAGV